MSTVAYIMTICLGIWPVKACQTDYSYYKDMDRCFMAKQSSEVFLGRLGYVGKRRFPVSKCESLKDAE
jgi:hypothetical protein